MEHSDKRKYYQDMVAAVREKLARLPKGSYIRSALPSGRLEQIAKRTERDKLEDLKGAYWPPIFVFVYRSSIPEIQSFESNIDLVVRHSRQKQARKITQFLEGQPRDDRLWAAGTFEIFVKSRFLSKKGLTVKLDCALPNGRDTDIWLGMEGRAFNLECTVITESDEDREVWDRFMAAKKVDSNATLVRPGRFDSPESKSPSPYYDCLRFYAKVYDKLAKDLDPRKSQMSEDDPNVLLISFYSPRAPLSPTSSGVGWALDELLANQPKSRARLMDYPTGLTDISLLAWLDFTARDLHRKSRLDLERYHQDFHEIVAAPRKIGGILLFEACSLKASRVNYNTKERCSLSHHEIARLEKLLETPPNWCHQ